MILLKVFKMIAMKEVKELLEITAFLKRQYEDKLNFSLDGRLVGVFVVL